MQSTLAPPEIKLVVRQEIGMRVERAKFAMPNKNTFSIKPIKRFVEEELEGLNRVLDPFAREARYGHITNDLNPKFDTDYNMDALAFLKMFDDNEAAGIIFDPPYSLRQLKECYDDIGHAMTQKESQSFYADIKNEIMRIVKPGGTVLSFGWNSMGIGKNRGFSIHRVMMVPHGGHHYDTICVAETKL